jgi:hypothetical protein
MTGQLQHHQSLDTTPPTPLKAQLQEAFLCIATVLSQDEIQEMNDDLAGQPEPIQLTRLILWQEYAEEVIASD